jgi:hypothetical protein
MPKKAATNARKKRFSSKGSSSPEMGSLPQSALLRSKSLPYQDLFLGQSRRHDRPWKQSPF